MKSSERDLLLVPGKGRVNKKRRYYSMKNALRRAMEDVINTNSSVVVHDAARGVDIVGVYKSLSGIIVRSYTQRRFKQLWSR